MGTSAGNIELTTVCGNTADEDQGTPGLWPTIPGYVVLAELGRGGMGVVYKARQLGLARLVALKMILAGEHAGPEALARFKAEAEAVARLQHPNLVQVHEVGEDHGRPYFSMELVDGPDLHKKFAGKPQPPTQAAALVEVLARTMDAFHQRGIVHRDLKPANILLAADGTPKITDFGLAKRLDAAAGPTLSGGILGTPSYMAPEQAQGLAKAVGPATDVYALGAILYQLLTGRPPFQAATPWDTIHLVTREEPVPPRQLQPTVPLDLETICLKCLRKDPSRRYPSALELAGDLGRFQAGEPIRARPVSLGERAVKWIRRRPAAAALLAVSALALLVVIVGSLVHGARLRDALQTAEDFAGESRRRLVRLHVAEGARALDEGDWLGALPWFAEALRLDQGDPGREEMHRLRLGAVLRQCPQLVHLWVHDGPVRSVTFRADGRAVLTVSEDHSARVWGVTTGEPEGPPLKHDGAVLHGSFHPDGRRVITAGADGLARVWEIKTARLALTLRHAGAVRRACFSPDGRWVLTASDDGTARLWQAETGKPLGILKHAGPVRHAAFSRGGRRVATASDDGTARVWDSVTALPASPPLKHGAAVLCASFSPDGRRVVTAARDGTARVWELPGRDLGAAPLRHRAAVVAASFSPDGGRIVTASEDHAACIWDAATGALLAPPLRQRSGLAAASFSPDGLLIVTGGDDNAARVWDAATGEPRTPLLPHNGSVRAVAFSPDGHWVLDAANDGTTRLWQLVPDGAFRAVKTTEPMAPSDLEGSGAWRSPDGKLLVTAEGDHGAQVREAATRRAVGPLLRHGSAVIYAAFTADGHRLITASDDNTARIWATQTGKLLTQPLRHEATAYFAAFSPDGRLVLTAGRNQTARVWDAAAGEPVTPPLRLAGTARRALFAAGTLSVTDADGKVWSWDLRPDDRSVADLLILAGVLSGCRIDPSRGLLPQETGPLRDAWQCLRRR